MNHIEAIQVLATTHRHRTDTPFTLAMKLGDLEEALTVVGEMDLLEEWMHKRYCRNSTDLACTLDEFMFWNRP